MSWFDEVKKIAARKALVLEQTDAETADMRWKTCWTCEHRDPSNDVCLRCGCYIAVKIWAKTSRSPARPFGELTYCPMGKWNDKELANHYRALDGHALLD